MEPQASALAKLTAYCVFASANLDNVEPFAPTNSRKRGRPEDYEVCQTLTFNYCRQEKHKSALKDRAVMILNALFFPPGPRFIGTSM